MGSIKRKKCSNCKCLFIPDHRNRNRQKYCRKPECRKTSKAKSQQKWLAKQENRYYFSGPLNVKRVQDWRKQNPGYWSRSKKPTALQDSLKRQHTDNIEEKSQNANSALQDPLINQNPVIIGLISNFIGSALQDDIAETLLRMQQSGQDILYSQPTKRGGMYDCKIADIKESSAQNP
ncbi:MAG: hypothetical protein GY795_37290 [Desulfobacterales bacterium]|nr:hypothetical protein [Desulfobacterales bacterium]